MESTPLRNDAHRQQTILAVALFVLVAILGYRAYGPRFSAQPTIELSATPVPVDLNRAERTQLVQVPGIGPNLADAILGHRSLVGRFDSLDDLQSVHGIGPKTLEKLKPWLRVEPGAQRDADEKVVQLARKVSNAQSGTGTSYAGNKAKAGDSRIDVNTASESELQRLPGIGPALAGRIAAARDVRQFVSVDDLRKVKGIGAKTLENIRPFITVE